MVWEHWFGCSCFWYLHESDLCYNTRDETWRNEIENEAAAL